MNNITLEQIDQVLHRMPAVSYADAKEALLATNGDVIEAIVYLENKSNKKNIDLHSMFENMGNMNSEMMSNIKDMIKKGNVVRVVIEKDGDKVINLPITVGAAALVLGPMATVLGLSAAMLTKYNVKITKENEEVILDLGELTEEKINFIKNMMNPKNCTTDSKDVTEDLMKESYTTTTTTTTTANATANTNKENATVTVSVEKETTDNNDVIME